MLMRCGCGECVYEWSTRGSGVLSSTGDMLVRGVGGVCDIVYGSGRCGWRGGGGEWMRELGLGFTNPVGTGRVLDMCLFFWLRCCGWCRWGVGRGLEPG